MSGGFKIRLGVDVTRVIEDAIEYARITSRECKFSLNAVTVVVRGDSDAKLIHRDWCRSIDGFTKKGDVVGPYPDLILSEEAIASDARIQAVKDERKKFRVATAVNSN